MPQSPKADAIIALTGGSGLRIRASVQLLEERAAPVLFISGVNESVDKSDIAKLAGGSESLRTCCIELGYMARSTSQNAVETAQWAAKSDPERLIIVTSDYHMPRSLLLLQRQMPERILIPYPVETRIDPERPFANLRTLKGLGTEWLKWRITLILYS